MSSSASICITKIQNLDESERLQLLAFLININIQAEFQSIIGFKYAYISFNDLIFLDVIGKIFISMNEIVFDEVTIRKVTLQFFEIFLLDSFIFLLIIFL